MNISRTEDFDKVCADYWGYIHKIALTQHIKGLEYDDIVSEMLICLWKAHQSWDIERKVSFKSYWWSLWNNRRYDLRNRDIKQNITSILTDDLTDLCGITEQHHLPECPSTFDRQERLLWTLIAMGFERKDIMQQFGFTQYRYDSTIRRWRDQPVLAGLSY